MTAQLTVTTADGRNFVRPINRDEFAIGRDSRNHLVLGDRQVSKFHCTLYRREGAHFIKDLGSSNGTLVNGIKAEGEVPVATGDRVRVGPYELIFAMEGEELALPPRPTTLDGITPPPGAKGGRGDTTTSKQIARGDAAAATAGPARRAVEIAEPTTPMDISGEIASTYSTSEGGTSSGRAYLEIIDGDGKGHMITIGSRGLTIGAGSRNHLVLDDPFVSRQHARVDRESERYLVRDLGSTNGIRVDGQDVAESVLEDGTRLQVGGVLMVFRWPASPAETSGAIHDIPQPRAHPGGSPGGPPGAPSVQHREPTTVPGAPVASPRTGTGAPVRSGRSAATVREMDAVMTSTLSMSSSHDSLKPEVRAAAPPPGERGVVRIGSLRFRRWQLLVLGFFGGLLVLALLYQIGTTLFGGGGGGEPTTSELFVAGKEAYLAGDWSTAEGYLAAVPAGDPNHGEAQQYLENIRVESENAERVDRITILISEGVFYRAFEIAQEIPPTSRYYAEAQALVERQAAAEARRLLEEASAHLEAKEVDEAIVLLDRAEAYDPEVEGLAELRAAIEEGPEAAKKAAQDHGTAVTTPAPDRGGAASGHPDATTAGSSKIAKQALELYLDGDVGGARGKLEQGIERAGSSGAKLELQDALGRIDKIERALAAGDKALDAGDLEVSLDRYESAYRDITRMDTSGKSARRVAIREQLAECLHRRGQQAYDRREYKRAAFEWNKGRKAWPDHEGIEDGRRRLEAVARDIYNDAVISEREGTDRGRDEARRLYEDVIDIAPQGDGYQYHDKARQKLEDL